MLIRVLHGVVALVAVLAASLSLSAGPVAADPPSCVGDDGGTYVCTQPGGDDDPGGPTGDDNGGGTTPAGPTCELYADFTFCSGTRACRMIEWQVPYKLPDGPKPQPDSVPLIRECNLGDPAVYGPFPLEIYWSDDGEPQPPTLAEQAQTAIGQLDLSLPALMTSPDGRTVVNFPTWYWLDGAETRQVGTSAFGLRAIATVSQVRVDPGDGSGPLDCPWVSTAEQAEDSCSYTYPRDSDDGTATYRGRPADVATASATWDVRFVYNGTPVANIPGAPDTLPGPVSEAVVRVDQVQSLVTTTR